MVDPLAVQSARSDQDAPSRVGIANPSDETAPLRASVTRLSPRGQMTFAGI